MGQMPTCLKLHTFSGLFAQRVIALSRGREWWPLVRAFQHTTRFEVPMSFARKLILLAVLAVPAAAFAATELGADAACCPSWCPLC